MLLLLVLCWLLSSVDNAYRVGDACLYNYRCNTRQAGFARFDAQGNRLAESVDQRGFDYVSGLVAKAAIEAVEASPSAPYVASWYYAIRDFGNQYCQSGFSTTPDDLDILNACKLYFTLRDVAASGTFGVDSLTITSCDTALARATRALAYYRTTYVISDSVSRAFCGSNAVAGGWWHKRKYENEMWCDGQYMGPALLAQLLVHGYCLDGLSPAQCWNDLIRQMDISWNILYNPRDQLLYHAFSASPQLDPAWADQDATSSHYGVSSEYWSRAIGWYFMALVDVLEAMQQTDSAMLLALEPDRQRLQTYLTLLAEGVARRQDAASGCWAQLLAYPIGYQPAGCDHPNYLESSASALFTAGYLKAVRLNLLPQSYLPMAKRAYRGLFRTFLTAKAADGNSFAIIDCCASAGLSNTRSGDAAYYLCGSDVTRITSYTEGKVLGAFLMAATEFKKTIQKHP